MDQFGVKIVTMYYSEHRADLEVTNAGAAASDAAEAPGAATALASDPVKGSARALGTVTPPLVPTDASSKVPYGSRRGIASTEGQYGSC